MLEDDDNIIYSELSLVCDVYFNLCHMGRENLNPCTMGLPAGF